MYQYNELKPLIYKGKKSQYQSLKDKKKRLIKYFNILHRSFAS